ncbi:TonB-dependent receptor [Pseudaquidulcibacter saccharophilus]|uniref:TonB-dependent receptor n=1 Tax=Pseudaquidulcibacter saccharophilus TaxID=2831900 RepID=UPI001EFF0D59|nr:TonB-dependent receptor [Pseudaquidulcibacter saccharophilus]
MKKSLNFKKALLGGSILAIFAIGTTQSAFAQENNTKPTNENTDENVVIVTGQTYATSRVSPVMIKRTPVVASVNDVVNELPGIIVTEADAFGSADWATSITMRGFNSGPGGQQIGTTIDGIPNGGSTYGGGSKANRYIDILDLKTVEVSQGTADLSSASNEALGGTLKFIVSDPKTEQALKMLYASGDQSAQKYYARFDSGEIAPNTYAFLSLSSARNKDYVDNFAQITRDHLSGKVISEIAGYKLTGFLSYDDANEAETDPSSLDYWKQNPTRDYLTSIWTGIPMIDQNYRDGWRAHRKNFLNYYRAEKQFGEIKAKATGYYHQMTGQGDWIPPYIVDVTNNAGGPETELTNTTVYGGSALGKIYFVLPNGVKANGDANCISASALGEGDPACYASNALAVMSYRHTHYKNFRKGALVDLSWDHDFGAFKNSLTGGLWYENGKSNVIRDWHKVLNAAIGPAYNNNPYYVQYRDNYTVEETNYYLEDILEYGPLTARFGLKQYFVDRTRERVVGTYSKTSLSSNSDPLFAFGLNYVTPIAGLEAFAGFSQNFNAISQGRMGESTETLKSLEPETADNIEFGLRYKNSKLNLTATLFDIKFDNRITYIADGTVSGIDYLSEVDGTYINLGGVTSKGLELLASYRATDKLRLSGSYTYNEATYDSGGNKETVDGTQVFGTPKTMAVLSADYTSGAYSVGISSKYIGKRFIDMANTQTADAYVMTNAYIGVNVENLSDKLKGVEARLTISNLTNEKYINGISDGAVYPGAPRTLLFSVSAEF